jgi:hypothetical protein
VASVLSGSSANGYGSFVTQFDCPDPRYKESMLGGVKWILGLEPGSAKPNPELEAPEIEKGKAAVAAKAAEFDAKSAK